MNSTEHYSIKQDSIYPTETIGFQIMEVCIMSKYSLKTIKNKARAAGYRVSKGFQHYLCSGAVCRDCNGEPYTGYIVEAQAFLFGDVMIPIMTISGLWKMLKNLSRASMKKPR